MVAEDSMVASAAKEVWAIVQFRFAGGSYNPDRVHLAPFQTVALDVQKLKDSEQRDIRKQVFPKGATHGQVVWLEETPGSMVGRAEILNVGAGTARSFSCSGPCQCPAEPDGTQCQPPTYTAPVGATEQFAADNFTADCNSTVYGPFQTNANWTSSNSSIVSLTSSGNATCKAPGSATLIGMTTQTAWEGEGCSTAVQVPSAAQCVVNVQKPTSATVISMPKTTYSNQTWTSCDATESKPNKYGINVV
jgi:uncharacterized protein YjdB